MFTSREPRLVASREFCFGEFRLDVARQELFRGETPVHLTPKAIQLLQILLSRAGEVVAHRELVDTLWPDVAVSDASLKNLVSLLRAALDDHEREGKFIRSVHHRGYAFNLTTAIRECSVERRASGYLTAPERCFELATGVTLVGRDSDCAVVLPYGSVSRQHARLELYAKSATIEDLASRNGTFVDGVRVTGRFPLAGHHEIRFGDVTTGFKRDDPHPSRLTAPVIAE